FLLFFFFFSFSFRFFKQHDLAPAHRSRFSAHLIRQEHRAEHAFRSPYGRRSEREKRRLGRKLNDSPLCMPKRKLKAPSRGATFCATCRLLEFEKKSVRI